MSHRSHPKNIFADQGVGLADIVIEGKLGGTSALRDFLQFRGSQLVRQMRTTPQDGPDYHRIRLGLAALADAARILDDLDKPLGGGERHPLQGIVT